MAFDLGFNNTDPTPEYTAAAIQKMDKRFDLVMITDRFEESIILMRDLLCMSEDDVIYLGMIYKLLVEQLYSQRMSLWQEYFHINEILNQWVDRRLTFDDVRGIQGLMRSEVIK